MSEYVKPEIIYTGKISIRAGSPIEGRFRDEEQEAAKAQEKVVNVEKENGTNVALIYNPREGWRAADPIIFDSSE